MIKAAALRLCETTSAATLAPADQRRADALPCRRRTAYENFAELDALTGVSCDFFHLNDITLGNFILLAAGFDHREHCKSRS